MNNQNDDVGAGVATPKERSLGVKAMYEGETSVKERALRAKAAKVNEEFNAYHFSKGQYYDRVLCKLLEKYKLSLNDYYKYGPRTP